MSDSFPSNQLIELFVVEANSHLSILREGLSALNAHPHDTVELEGMLRAATALKSAAKIAALEPVFQCAQHIESLLAAAEQGERDLTQTIIAGLGDSVQLLAELVETNPQDLPQWLSDHHAAMIEKAKRLQGLQGEPDTAEAAGRKQPGAAAAGAETNTQATRSTKTAPARSKAAVADLSMRELFRMEAETQTQTLTDGLVNLESSADAPELMDALMRAAHSLKGAARMVGLDAAVDLAHLMEDIFVAAQQAKISIESEDIDLLLASVDFLAELARATADDYEAWLARHEKNIDELTSVLGSVLAQAPRKPLSFKIGTDDPGEDATPAPSDDAGQAQAAPSPKPDEKLNDNIVRVSSHTLDRLQGLAGEAMVETHWLGPFSDSLLKIKKRQAELVTLLDRLREQMFDMKLDEALAEVIHSAHLKGNQCREMLAGALTELDSYDRRSSSLSHRLHREVLQARMRPFSDGVQGYQRMVRDLSRSLDKQVKLDIRGLSTQVDRDILEKLQAPLNHMIRNAVDHGIEPAEARVAAGKPAQGTIRLEAMHTAGMLSIVVQDDGCGIDLEQLRDKIVAKKLVNQEMASSLSESELLEFMFLPNFSTRDAVTEYSGRGVGLDVVHNVVQELRGQIRASSDVGKGTKFQFQLPLTLSVLRTLVVDVAGELYAFPLGRIDQTLKISKASIETMEGREYFTYGNRHIGLITAHQILEQSTRPEYAQEISVVLTGDRVNKYGIIVDKFLGERNVVVHTLDERLGKIQDISSASLTEEGEPLLIFDVDDVLRSIDIILSGGRLDKLASGEASRDSAIRSKRVLVVDDSITVRETERNLLQSKGYQVEVAVDGMDGWNAARTSQYDLIVSDIDMPRMNGFELVSMLKSDAKYKDVPVIIVSYKDREEDRQRGMEAGADYYLTKGSFHDDSLIEAVVDLIGDP